MLQLINNYKYSCADKRRNEKRFNETLHNPHTSALTTKFMTQNIFKLKWKEIG